MYYLSDGAAWRSAKWFGQPYGVVLLFQQQRGCAGLYEVAGTELVDQDVVQVVAIALVHYIHGLLQPITGHYQPG